jgi:hypothetical protein
LREHLEAAVAWYPGLSIDPARLGKELRSLARSLRGPRPPSTASTVHCAGSGLPGVIHTTRRKMDAASVSGLAPDEAAHIGSGRRRRSRETETLPLTLSPGIGMIRVACWTETLQFLPEPAGRGTQLSHSTFVCLLQPADSGSMQVQRANTTPFCTCCAKYHVRYFANESTSYSRSPYETGGWGRRVSNTTASDPGQW